MDNDLLRTVAYFTSMGQSVTAHDVWQWMYTPSREWSLLEVTKSLEDVRSPLSQRDGRFVLRGHEEIFDNEHKMYLDADRKYRNVKRYMRWVSKIPGVRAVAVCNTLAWESTTRLSDSDFLVIARKGTLWFTRFLAVVPLIIFKMRPGERNVDSVDFTFFISDSKLSIEHLQIDGGDPYLAYWTASLVPVVDDGVMFEFRNANEWVQDILPNATPRWLASFRRPQASSIKSSTKVNAYLESFSKRMSIKRFPALIRTQMNKSTNVIVTDDMLKFHVDDQRIKIRDNWKKIYEQYS